MSADPTPPPQVSPVDAALAALREGRTVRLTRHGETAAEVRGTPAVKR